MLHYKVWTQIEVWDDERDSYENTGEPMATGDWLDSEDEARAEQLAHASDAERERENALNAPKCMIIDFAR